MQIKHTSAFALFSAHCLHTSLFVALITKHMKKLALLIPVAMIVAGCSSMKELEEPKSRPLYVVTFEDPKFENCAELAVDIDLEDCTEHAMMVRKGIFGSSEIEAWYPIRDLIKREVSRAVEENFHITDVREKSDICLELRTHRTVLSVRGSKATFDLAINMRVLPAEPGLRPLYRKSYRAHCVGEVENEDQIPGPVYQAIQQVVNEFMMDIADNRNLVAYFEDKSAAKMAETNKQMKGNK